MVSKSIGGKVMKLDYDLANQLTQTQIRGAVLAPSATSTGAQLATESVSYQYDKAGRLLSEQSTINPQLSTKSYSYSYLDKVRSVSVNGAVTASYTYDAAGMLVHKTNAKFEMGNAKLNPQSAFQTPQSSEAYLWNGIALLSKGQDQYSNESHLTGGLPLVTKTVGSETSPIQTPQSAIRNQYSTFDYLGTSLWSEEQKESKESGSTAFSHGLTSYGESLTTGGALLATPVTSSPDSKAESRPLTAESSPRFTGKPYDADLGAYVFPFRNYRPELARWTSADPAGFPDGSNGHFYAPVATSEVDICGDKKTKWIKGTYTLTATWTEVKEYQVGAISLSFPLGISANLNPPNWGRWSEESVNKTGGEFPQQATAPNGWEWSQDPNSIVDGKQFTKQGSATYGGEYPVTVVRPTPGSPRGDTKTYTLRDGSYWVIYQWERLAQE